ncbi:MAG TPA: sulfotransferase [Acidimicrobiia bacterium]|nr:sulfotransferase [Acidimicrobiia bacterium]
MALLPNFVIVGAMRGGSSALARALSRHPDVFVAPGKEMHYFNRHFERGIDWYQSRLSGGEAAVARGDATPLYMYDQLARRRMIETLPDARFLAIIRDPVDRAYSHYWHNRRRERESRTFEEAVKSKPSEQVLDYLGLSRYAEHLKDLESAAPGRLLVLINEDLRHRRAETLHRAWAFIGVDPGLGSVEPPAPRRSLMARIRQRRRAPKDYPPLAPSTRAGLAKQFTAEVDALEAWLDRDLSAWRA